MSRSLRFAAALCAWLLWAPLTQAVTLDADEAEALVRKQWAEGVPEERIAPLSPSAVDRLAALLADSGERRHHAAALEMLGRAGGPGAYEIVISFAGSAPEGVADPFAHRTQLALPLALGHLARHDDRALADLIRFSTERPTRRWQTRHLDHDRVARILRQSFITGLALAGRDETRALLLELANDDAGKSRTDTPADDHDGVDPRIRAHARAMLELHARSRAALRGSDR